MHILLLLLAALTVPATAQAEHRPRAREAGIVIGVLPTGPLNAITDVAGVKVGQVTIIEGANIAPESPRSSPTAATSTRTRCRQASRSAMPTASSWARPR